MTAIATPSTLDLRDLMMGDRHRRVFAAFHALPEGGTLELVNDHDPMPLYHQLQSRHPGTFTWRCREQGPDAWRIEIVRTHVIAPATHGCCGACGA